MINKKMQRFLAPWFLGFFLAISCSSAVWSAHHLSNEKSIVFRHVPGPSPALTISNFTRVVGDSILETSQALSTGLKDRSLFWSDETRAKIRLQKKSLINAANALNMSAIPDRFHLEQESVVNVLLLHSLLKYDIDNSPKLVIPDVESVEKEGLQSWMMPNTPIELEVLSSQNRDLAVNTIRGLHVSSIACRICDRKDFLFSPKTLKLLDPDYDLTFPFFRQNSDLLEAYVGKYYRYWFYSPGGLLPPKILLMLPAQLQDVLLTVVFHHSLLQLLTGLSLTFVLGFVWVKILTTNVEQLAQVKNRVQNLRFWILALSSSFLQLIIAWTWKTSLISWVNIHLLLSTLVIVIYTVCQTLSFCLIVYACGETLCSFLERNHYTSDDQLKDKSYLHSAPLSTVIRIISILVLTVYLIGVIRSFGINVFALVAIGTIPTLILSLSMQDVVKDIFEGFTVFLEGKFKDGDYVCFQSLSGATVCEGTILSTGMRSIILKSPNGSIVTVPNSVVATSKVNNYSLWRDFSLELSIPLSDLNVQDSIAIKDHVVNLLGEVHDLEDNVVCIDRLDDAWILKVLCRWTKAVDNAKRQAITESIFVKLQDYLLSLKQA